jgi:hypothetical protein
MTQLAMPVFCLILHPFVPRKNHGWWIHCEGLPETCSRNEDFGKTYRPLWLGIWLLNEMRICEALFKGVSSLFSIWATDH